MTLLWHSVFLLIYICDCATSKLCQNMNTVNGNTSGYEKYQMTTVDIITDIGPQMCVKECRLRPDCGEVVYKRRDLTCVLTTNTNTIDSRDHIQTYLGSCTNQICGKRTRCVALTSEGQTCVQLDMKEGSIRLQNGSNPSEGRVEIYYGGVWGAISGRSDWTLNNAKVVCRQLRYSYGVPLPKLLVGGADIYLLNLVTCVGTEEMLIECIRSEFGNWGPSNNAYDYVGVICSNSSFDEGGKVPIRLSGGSSEAEGVLEVFYAGYWGTVACTLNYIAKEEADIICKQLNYSAGNLVGSSFFSGYQKQMVWRKCPTCGGSELIFTDCSFPLPWGESDSMMSYDISVLCEDPNRSNENDTVRLVTGDQPQRGRVEIKHYEIWGTISTPGWDDRDAKVVCRELGYSNGFAIHNAYVRAPDEYTQWLSEVDCNGNEERLADCPHGGWHMNLNRHYLDAGVVCSLREINATAEGQIRIVDGPSDSEGRLEMYVHGLWTSMCYMSATNELAKVACRQLGWSDGLLQINVQQGSGPILIHNFKCNGDEQHLFHCTRRYYHIITCTHLHDIGVLCVGGEPYGPEEGNLRLTHGNGPEEGRVEVNHAGIWGSIWDRNAWTDANVRVVCNQLGFSTGRAVQNSFFEEDLGPVWMGAVTCGGEESRLIECDFDGWGKAYMFPPITPSAFQVGIGVVCSNTNVTALYGDIRLVGMNTTNAGRIEIYGPTGYSTLNSRRVLHDEVYVVICRQLGLQFSESLPFRPQPGQQWGFYISCNGMESRFNQCTLSGWTDYDMNPRFEDAGVVCVP